MEGNGTDAPTAKRRSPATGVPAGESPILDVRLIAGLLGHSAWKVRAWTAAGVIPHWRSGNSIYHHRAEVLDWWQNGRWPPKAKV